MIKKIQITFTEELLGTASSNAEVHEEFIASKAPNAKSREEEIEAIGVAESIEKAMTIFPKENEKPFMWDYQIKGFFKDACGMLARCSDTESSKLKAYKKIIDGLIFVEPRKIFLTLPEGKKLGSCQRPLRGQTAQGERIALANSETCPEGTSIIFTINIMDKKYENYVEEWLSYGKLRGLGQWRNSGKGRFDWKEMQ
jgi:hypothetical protein